jgi:hypothetical protein
MYKKIALAVLAFSLLFSAELIAATWGDGAAGVAYYNGGNVGIGMTDPVMKLSVLGSVQVLYNGHDSIAGTGFYLGNGTAGSMLRHTLTGRALAFDTYNSSGTWVEAMRLSRVGLLGIGTSAPAGILQVQANQPSLIIQNTGTFSADPSMIKYRDKNGSVHAQMGTILVDDSLGVFDSHFTIKTAVDSVLADRIFINNAGNIGLGTASPVTKLDVSGNTRISSQAGSTISDTNLSLYDTSTSNQGVGGGVSFGGRYDGNPVNYAWFGEIKAMKENATAGDYGGALVFGSRPYGGAPAERMRITSLGAVGIGMTAPLSQLHVVTPGSIGDGDFRVGGNLGNYGIVVTYNQYGPTIGAIYSNMSYNSSASLLKLGVNANNNPNQLVLMGNGNVGVGTSMPSTAFEVSGNFKSNGQFTGSSRTLKKDIDKLAASDYTQILDSVNKLDLVRFRYKTQAATDPRTVGVIAEDSPVELLAADKKSVNTITYTSYALAAIKAQQLKISALEKKNQDLEKNNQKLAERLTALERKTK